MQFYGHMSVNDAFITQATDLTGPPMTSPVDDYHDHCNARRCREIWFDQPHPQIADVSSGKPADQSLKRKCKQDNLSSQEHKGPTGIQCKMFLSSELSH